MVDVTITNQAGQTFTFQDGDVGVVESRISSTPDADPMPLSAPGDTIIFDLNGSSKNITITGMIHDSTGSTRVSGQTVETIAQQKRWLESMQTGSQEPVQFSSNYDQYTFVGDGSVASNINTFVAGNNSYQTYVVVLETAFTENAGEPNNLPFVIRLVAGSQ